VKGYDGMTESAPTRLSSPRISLIAAMAQNRVIGRAGLIPWKVPGEQLFFKRTTLGHTVIMGRKTFESIGRPLPGRTNVVISRRTDMRPEGCLMAQSLQAALQLCPAGEDEAFIIGGGQLYAAALPITDRIYLTVIPLAVDGDAFFPEIPAAEFALSASEHVPGALAYDILIYDRVRGQTRPSGEITVGREQAAGCKGENMNETPISYGWNPEMPVGLQEKLKEDLKTAMRAKNETLRNTIRQVMSEFFRLTVPVTLEGGKKSTRPKKPEEITNDDIIGIIQGLVKSEHIVLEARKEASSDYLRILEAYLPRSATREEIVAWVRENIDFSKFKNRMQAMGVVMKHFGKSADGKLVNQILQDWQ
jgi:uncharacterized protein